MPYIEQKDREKFKSFLENIVKNLDSDESYYYVMSTIISFLRIGIEDRQQRWIETTLDYDQRKIFYIDINQLVKILGTVGHYNYCITFIAHQYIINKNLRYTQVNSIIGILEEIRDKCTTYHQKGVLRCLISEFYRKVVADYENLKINKNGNISKLDI